MYYLVKIQSGTNGNSQAMPAYNTYDEALAAYHSELAYRAEGRTSTLCVILDEYGNTINKELWRAAPAED